ncbi:helix-turn-helix domain-containing protein [Catellatospora sp. KI3]|uniref:helix-turn-helix domain-containing protein n=1 Tax=Catellatospora sp. KI3 TaxID=3041620 RepID=UPI002482BBAE|nr:helix-turn-helix domain-containing protein [Catellatospora sp. KI3]MDI1463491.1 helix-turn-helix domain-containing protein [Catellatospora sp. KI3]
MNDSSEPALRRTFADKLNHLFETVHGPDRRPYSNRQVAEAVNSRAAATDGPTIDHSYLSKLRAGGRAKPSFDVVEALAAFFGVKVDYFGDDETTARIDAQLALLAAMRDAGVRDLALRAAGLSPQGLDTVTALLDQVRRYEGLAPADDGPTPPA